MVSAHLLKGDIGTFHQPAQFVPADEPFASGIHIAGSQQPFRSEPTLASLSSRSTAKTHILDRFVLESNPSQMLFHCRYNRWVHNAIERDWSPIQRL